MKASSCLSMLAALLAGFATPGANAVTYTLTDLGSTYFVNGFQAKVLNDAGEVIGSDPADNGHAFMFSAGAWHDLGTVNTSGMGSAGSIARGLNNLGAVVGQADTGAAAQTDAFLTPGVSGPLAALGLVGGGGTSKDAVANAINDRGTIVGSLIDNTAQTIGPFLFQAGVGPRLLPAATDYLFAINNFGDLLGRSTGETPRALVNGVPLPKALDAFIPHAINHAGQILLSADAANPVKGAWGMIYDYGSGKMTKLPNLSKKSFGYTSYFDINDFGQVVGRGADEDEVPHAVFYSPETGLVSLEAMNFEIGGTPVHLIEARGINNKGQILCAGYLEGDPAGVTRNILLTPDAAPVFPLAAAYDGLASVGGANLGAVTITVSKTNIASVKLVAHGVSHSFTVTLTNGGFTGPVTVKGVTLNVAIQADATRQKITGTIADTTTYDVTALRQAKLGGFAGTLTALLQRTGPVVPGIPQDIGWGQMKVTKTGSVKMSGQLADGSKFSASGQVHTDGTWTFYAPLYTKEPQPGGLTGLMTFNRRAIDSDCSGTLRWNKPGDPATDLSCKAARYNPGKNQQVLTFTNKTAGVAAFAFTGGEQTLAAHTLSVSEKNVVTVTDAGPDELAVKITTGTGALGGSFIHDGSGEVTKFTGVVQQKLNIAAGVFQGTTTGGSVRLTPQ